MKHHLNFSTITELANALETTENNLWYLYRNIDRFVTPHFVKKKNGKLRKTFRTSNPLKETLGKFNRFLQTIYLPPTLQGAVPGRSPLSNAVLHVNSEIVISLDIKDFFPSVHYTRVYKLFLLLNCSPIVAKLLTRITTYEGALAQGFPTSSTIANLLLKELEPRISKLCAQHGLKFSFFQDDLTISGNLKAKRLSSLFSRIIEQCGFTLNKEKTKLATKNERQTVTGVIANQKPNISKSYYRNLRATIHNCSINGIVHESQKAGMEPDKFIRSIQGKIDWVITLNPARGEKLLAQFKGLKKSSHDF